jgi:hypothetical protein
MTNNLQPFSAESLRATVMLRRRQRLSFYLDSWDFAELARSIPLFAAAPAKSYNASVASKIIFPQQHIFINTFCCERKFELVSLAVLYHRLIIYYGI